jgi:ABC-2 type transport system ATP-binding protein
MASRVQGAVRVRSPDAARLRERLAAAGLAAAELSPDVLSVPEATSEQVGEIAGAAGIVLHELVRETGTLEEAFLELTRGETI